MEHDYKVKNLTQEEIQTVFPIINDVTGIDVKELVIDAAQSGSHEAHLNCLDTLGFLCMKTIIVMAKLIERNKRDGSSIQ